jgi:hypothetical protein
VPGRPSAFGDDPQMQAAGQRDDGARNRRRVKLEVVAPHLLGAMHGDIRMPGQCLGIVAIGRICRDAGAAGQEVIVPPDSQRLLDGLPDRLYRRCHLILIRSLGQQQEEFIARHACRRVGTAQFIWMRGGCFMRVGRCAADCENHILFEWKMYGKQIEKKSTFQYSPSLLIMMHAAMARRINRVFYDDLK